jgi:adenylate kinase family enzyme
MNNNRGKLVVMRGAPGQGKSTLANKLLSEHLTKPGSTGIICSADQYYMKSGKYQWDATKIHLAHGECRANCRDALKNRIEVIFIDNTNTDTQKEALWYVMAGAVFGYDIHFLSPQTDWMDDPALLAMKNRHGVPEQKCKAMLDKIKKSGTLNEVVDYFKKHCDYQNIFVGYDNANAS